jgi:hypothetical protein
LGLKGSRRLWFLLVLLFAAGIAAYFTLNSEGPLTPTAFPVVLEPSSTPQMAAGIDCDGSFRSRQYGVGGGGRFNG